MDWDEAAGKKKPVYEVGGDLSRFSVAELEGCLALLAEERARIEAALAAKRASQQAANSVFKL